MPAPACSLRAPSRSAVSPKAYVLQLDDMGAVLQACSEGSLFGACMIWAGESDKKIDDVEQLLPLIRFPLMTQQELQVYNYSCTSPLLCILVQAIWCLAGAMLYLHPAESVTAVALHSITILWHQTGQVELSTCMQVVRAHPLANQSSQLQHLIAEAMAAQQGSHDLSPTSQVQLHTCRGHEHMQAECACQQLFSFRLRHMTVIMTPCQWSQVFASLRVL